MKFERSYDGTRPTYRIDYGSFVRPLNYISPKFERQLRSRYAKIPKYNPLVKRLNTVNTAGYAGKIKNY